MKAALFKGKGTIERGFRPDLPSKSRLTLSFASCWRASAVLTSGTIMGQWSRKNWSSRWTAACIFQEGWHASKARHDLGRSRRWWSVRAGIPWSWNCLVPSCTTAARGTDWSWRSDEGRDVCGWKLWWGAQ